MPNTREKLIELLTHDDCPIFMVFGDNMEGLVDYLIANGVTVQQWIPVTERLPEKSGSFLVCSENDSVYESHFHTKKYFLNGYMREAGFTKRGKVAITHWMPLPEPPKGE